MPTDPNRYSLEKLIATNVRMNKTSKRHDGNVVKYAVAGKLNSSRKMSRVSIPVYLTATVVQFNFSQEKCN
jgi:hypothetical protein